MRQATNNNKKKRKNKRKQQQQQQQKGPWERPPDAKAKRTCWGCNKEEPHEHAFTQQCPRCHEEGFVPALFCSQRCYNNAWPRHKDWHEVALVLKDNVLVAEAAAGANEDDLIGSNSNSNSNSNNKKEEADYNALVEKGERLFYSGELAKAKKVLRKAQKLDTLRPEAFKFLAGCFGISELNEEGLSCMEQACWRWALMALPTTQCTLDDGDNNRDHDHYIEEWVRSIFMIVLFGSINLPTGRKKPNWWYQNARLKRITKVALALLNDSNDDDWNLKRGHARTTMIFHIARLRAYLLAGTFNRGRVAYADGDSEARMVGIFCRTMHRTLHELQEAVQLLEFVVEACNEETDKDFYRDHLLTAKAVLGFRQVPSVVQSGDFPTYDSPWEEGMLVLLHGLQSPKGRAMNHQVGIVAMDWESKDGRVAVKVDGVTTTTDDDDDDDDDEGEIKAILPQNLVKIPCGDINLALIDCLPEREQWRAARLAANKFRNSSACPLDLRC